MNTSTREEASFQSAPPGYKSTYKRWPEFVLILSWFLALTCVLALPALLASPTLGADQTRWTIRLALVFYTLAAVLMLLQRPGEETAAQAGVGLTRWCWTLAWCAYLVHLGMAFHHYHHWSHAEAVRHTRATSGFGEGIYASHLFTLLWTLDVIYWWLRPQAYAARARWQSRWLHVYMVFIIFNSTIVFAEGAIRWAAGFAFLLLAVLLARRC